MTDPVQDTGKPTKVSTKPGDCGTLKSLFGLCKNAPKPPAAAPTAKEGIYDNAVEGVKVMKDVGGALRRRDMEAGI